MPAGARGVSGHTDAPAAAKSASNFRSSITGACFQTTTAVVLILYWFPPATPPKLAH